MERVHDKRKGEARMNEDIKSKLNLFQCPTLKAYLTRRICDKRRESALKEIHAERKSIEKKIDDRYTRESPCKHCQGWRAWSGDWTRVDRRTT